VIFRTVELGVSTQALPLVPAHDQRMADHLGTYSALVSASELALSAWLGQDQDAETQMHATNVLAFVLGTIGPELPASVREFRAVVPSQG
jgi:hypothetical protein